MDQQDSHKYGSLCNEIFHDDLTHYSVLSGLAEGGSGPQFLALRAGVYLVGKELQSRLDRLGGMAGEW